MQKHQLFWQKNEAENGPFFLIASKSDDIKSIGLSVLDSTGQTVQTASLVPADQLLITNGPEWATKELCKFIVDSKYRVPGLFSPTPTSRTASEELMRLARERYQLVKALLHLELRQPLEPRRVSGKFRTAQTKDLQLIASHRSDLQAESNTQRPFDGLASAQTDLAAGSLFIWTDQHARVVASASLYQNRTPNGAYINHVYVKPEDRRKGYASAIVGQLCKVALEMGQIPTLAVDVDNKPAVLTY
ncbi:MAG: GNAT family N-acetyltransferase [Chloroflexota bacterium]